MIRLLINKSEANDINATSFGGNPVKNVGEDFQWPCCKHCSLPLQFLGKIEVEDVLHQIFMCQNDPGMCDDWDANAGANSVVVTTPIELVYVSAPSNGVPLRETEYWSSIVEVDEDDYDVARTGWAEKNDVSPRNVLGQISGVPTWIQHDEVPECDTCKKPMDFVVQLETGPDYKTEMNFGGGGIAYSFRCACNGSAKFLWQC